MTNTVAGQEKRTLPALFGHCQTVYGALEERTQEVEYQGKKIKLYEGHLTRLFTKELNLSVPYYSSVMTALKQMDCVRQVKRGGGGAPSQWLLLREPTPDLFVEHNAEIPTSKASKERAQQQQTSDMVARLNAIEEKVEILFADFLERGGAD